MATTTHRTRTTLNSQRAGLVDQLGSATTARLRRATATPERHPSDRTLDEDPLGRISEDPDPDHNPGGSGGGDPNPDDDPDFPDPGDDPDDPEDDNDDDEPNLATALKKLAKSLKKPKTPRSKVKEPDTFDGSDSRLLRNFLVQLALNFRDSGRRDSFKEDNDKVNYALSFLRGTALEWFEPDILDPDDDNPPEWLSDYKAFVKELKDNFGLFDPTGDAEDRIETLHMRDNQRITKYNVEFNRLASLIEWDDAALCHKYYQGLPTRIKDDMARVGKPRTMTAMRRLAHDIDARYWKRKDEISRETSGSANRSSGNNNNSSSKSSSSKQSNSKPNNNNTNQSNKPSTSSTPAQSTSRKGPDLSNKLGKDGKLLPEERKRRLDNNLCLFCGGPGHISTDCTVKAKRLKARKAEADSASGSKK
jgi:Zinc knuckle./Retrotransposon gag protein.